VQLSPAGILQRTFTTPAGGCGEGGCIAVNASRDLFFGGGMDYTWGTPVNPKAGPVGSWDGYVVKYGGPQLDYFIGKPELPTAPTLTP
jgi:hypothetical protein